MIACSAMTPTIMGPAGNSSVIVPTPRRPPTGGIGIDVAVVSSGGALVGENMKVLAIIWISASLLSCIGCSHGE